MGHLACDTKRISHAISSITTSVSSHITIPFFLLQFNIFKLGTIKSYL